MNTEGKNPSRIDELHVFTSGVLVAEEVDIMSHKELKKALKDA